jgi:hypothetical protein
MSWGVVFSGAFVRTRTTHNKDGTSRDQAGRQIVMQGPLGSERLNPQLLVIHSTGFQIPFSNIRF